MELKVTDKAVLDTIEKYPEVKPIMKNLFPSLFKDEEIFCSVGSVFRRAGHNNNYAVVLDLKTHHVNLINLTCGNTFKNSISEYSITNFPKLTVKEFKQLITNPGDFEQFVKVL